MTFESLFEALEQDQINGKADKLIVEKVLEAERDWVAPVPTLADFLDQIEKEIGGRATKSNLSKLQERYLKNGFTNSAWQAESIYSLQEIFDLTVSDDLNSVFTELSKRINTI